MIKILYLVDTGDFIGGGEVSLTNLIRYLDKNRFRALVVMPDRGSFYDKLRDMGVEVEVMQAKKIKNPLNIFRTLASVIRLKKFIKKHGISLVHSNSSGGIAVLGSIAARLSGVPFVWHVRTVDHGGMLDLLQCLLSTRIVAISRNVAFRFRWLPVKNKIRIIYNGVDLSEFNPGVAPARLRLECGFPPEAILVGSVGRFHPVKHYEYFIQAASIVAKSIPEARFFIAGFGCDPSNPYLGYLKQLSIKHDLEKRIVFMKERMDIAPLLACLDVFVFTSINEPFGRVIIEAMACGKPVVTFNSGGAVEIIEDQVSGLLVNEADARTMAEKIVQVLKQEGMRQKLSDGGIKRVTRFFDIKDHVSKIEHLYLELLRMGTGVPGECCLCGCSVRDVLESEGEYKVIRCKDCGLVFTDPAPDKRAIQEHYTKEYYDPWLANQENFRRRIWSNRLSKLSRFKQGGSLLDVGCGCALFIEMAKEKGWNVAGTEVSDYAVKYSKEKLGLDVAKSELKDAGFAQDSFDVVTFWHVLEHTTDPLENLKCAYKLLKPGGILIAAVPNLNDLIYNAAYTCVKLKRPRIFSYDFREIHLYHFTTVTLRRMLRKAGFEDIRFDIDTGRVMLKEQILDVLALGLYKISGINIGIALEVYATKK